MGKIQASGETRMTRRSVLCGALVTAAVAAARTVLPQQMQTHLPPRVAAKAAGKPVTFLIGQGYNHYEMFETLGNPYGLLGRAMLEQMKLKTA